MGTSKNQAENRKGEKKKENYKIDGITESSYINYSTNISE